MAWVTWLTVHIFFLVGFRNRLAVVRNWAWTYLRRQDGVRLIEGSEVLPGWAQLAGSAAPETTGTASPSASQAAAAAGVP